MFGTNLQELGSESQREKRKIEKQSISIKLADQRHSARLKGQNGVEMILLHERDHEEAQGCHEPPRNARNRCGQNLEILCCIVQVVQRSQTTQLRDGVMQDRTF